MTAPGRIAGSPHPAVTAVLTMAAASVVLSTLAGAPARADTTSDGWAAYQARRFEDAVRLWLPAARDGNPEAAFGLGIAYDLGQGVPTDPLVACRWYRRGGAGGQVSAMFNAAVLYDSGRCGPRRADLAALWYGRAAAFGHGRAQFDLAQLYAAGDGVPRNPDQAAAWYRAAADSGIAAAAERAVPPRRLRRATRLGNDDVSLFPANPVSPDDAKDADLKIADLKDGGAKAGVSEVALVWDAPAQPEPVHYFVEVDALDPQGPREVMARYVDVSATLVRLAPDTGLYAWRVLTVSAASAHYVAGPWRRFSQGARP